MPRKKYKEKEEKESRWAAIGTEIKKSVAAVLLIGIAIVLFLASFKLAGPVGEAIYNGLTELFGWGYYLLPLVALTIALVFILTHEVKWLSPTFVGAFVFILGLLSLIDIVLPGRAGLAGNFLGLIEVPFGTIAGLVIVAVLVIASLLVTLNVPIRLRRKPKELELTVKEPFEEKNDDEEEEQEEEDVKIVAPPPPDKSKPAKSVVAASKNYIAPPLTLLKSTFERPTSGDLRANANIIKRTLENFGVAVEMGEVSIGPKVTRYTLKPAEGVKITRILALNQDLALALAAHPLRIEAPIPGKSLVGIEVPNKSAAIVRLGSLMAYPEFRKSGPLAFILGRDVNGDPIVADVSKMPHLLVSGATGSGKSIMIHSLIVSMLYKNSPENFQMVLIDPKRVELSTYNGIPHLVAPVITEGKKAVNVFRWAIQEMDRRYETLLTAGARDIASYNSGRRNKPMPYLMIVVDELADLMAAHGRDVEAAVVRLAQMSRATGIHLILSTQRPSVEVITGLIKANITARIALQVASQIDSRTILDTAGAEKLLGGGDMLFVSPESSKPKRIQGAYVSEDEVHKVSSFVRSHNQTSETIESPTDDLPPDLDITNVDQDADDDLYGEAVTVVTQAKKASASLLQRRLKIGYARAARLLDMMEAKGLIGPGEGAKPREVYAKGVQENSDAV